MTPPSTIPFSSIELGERGRSTYSGIEQLAQLIQDNGLIQPLVLVPLNPVAIPLGDGSIEQGPAFGLDAGGRRYHALKLLGTETLYHATTSEPGRPGFVLKGEEFATPLQRLMTEIAENLGREDLDWRDECALIVKAYRMSQKEAHSRGEEILMVDFGSMLGTNYQDLRAAVAIYDDLVINPDRYKEVTSIRGAYVKVFKASEVELTKILVTKSLVAGPKLPGAKPGPVQIQSEPAPMIGKAPPVVIPLTDAFVNCNSLEYMVSLSGPTFDHIITDPDYGVSVERLEANMDTGAGVAQATVADSLSDLKVFIAQSFRVIKDQGFLVFWYDLDHHEKLQAFATSVGFRVQRWPLIWHKTDYFSNADTAHNFTKNMEYAMVCRKPNAVLSQVQKTSIFQCATGDTTKLFNHPFAKPLDVWRWIYSAVAIKGQTTYDPFLGSASSACAAIGWGLKPMGSEIDAGNYANGLMNLQGAFKKLIGQNVVFS